MGRGKDFKVECLDFPDLIYPAINVGARHITERQTFGRYGIGDKRDIFRPHNNRNQILAMALSQPGQFETLAADLQCLGVSKPLIGLYTVDGLRCIGLGNNLGTGVDVNLAA